MPKKTWELPKPEVASPPRGRGQRDRALPARRHAAPAASGDDLQRHSLLSFFELSKELDYSLNVYDFADRALFNFMGHLGTPHSALWLLSATDTGSLVLLRSHGIPENAARQIGTQCIETLVDVLLRDRRIQHRDELAGVFTPDDLELLGARGLALFAPLLAPDRLLGVVALGTRATGAVDPFEIEVLQASVEFFAVALQNSVFYHQLQENVRELRQANENLQELDRAKNEFVSNMHHELRTPLTVVQMYAESLMEEMPAGGQRQRLEVVLAQTEKLKKMLETLLDFSALASNRIEVHCAPADVAALLQRYYEERRNGVAMTLHDFRLAVADGLPTARCEERRLRQVLDILLDNAVRFTPAGAPISLRAQPDDGDGGPCLRIDMEDTGPGIPAEKLSQLFDPFVQVDGSLTREKNGLGLGLALAHRLVLAMGGQILVRSAVGRGSTFTVLLPLA